MTDFSEIRNACMQCTNCPLHETRTNVVFGVGNPDAKILFVGEAPGENEDLQGEPFVGRGGQLLDLYLNGVGLDRKSNIYITNILRCRPPHNRDPRPEEQQACLPFLRQMVKQMQPKVIVCVGRIAAQVIISKDFTYKSAIAFTAFFSVIFSNIFVYCFQFRQVNQDIRFSVFVCLIYRYG